MPSYFTDAEKTEIETVMSNVFDSFKESTQLTFYKKDKRVVVMHDPNYDAGWDDDQGTSVTHTEQSDTFDAWVWYPDEQDMPTFFPDTNDEGLKFTQEKGIIKIKVRDGGKNYLDGVERVLAHGNEYRLIKGAAGVGFFEPKFWTYYLQRLV